MSELINDYVMVDDWHTVAEGAWAEVRKNESRYFLKRYTNVAVEPDRSKIGSMYTAKAYERHLNTFKEFKKKRDRINKTLWNLTEHGGNIVVPFDYFVYDHTYTEVTDFYDESLSETQIIALPDAEKILLFRTLAATLRAIHRCGLVHSDIKASNVVCTKSPADKHILKLIDFGASYFVDDKPTSPEEFSGDQNYASPELGMVWICEEAELDPEEYIAQLNDKSDIFSLGILFHLFLCGKRPVYQGVDIKKAFGGREERLVYPFELILQGGYLVVHPDITDPIYRKLLGSMLASDPDERPSADEVLQTLKEIPLPFSTKFGMVFSKHTPKVKSSAGFDIDEPWDFDNIVWMENVEAVLTANRYVGLLRKKKGFSGRFYCLVDKDGNETPVDRDTLLSKGYARPSDAEIEVEKTEDAYSDEDHILREYDQARFTINVEMLRSKNIKIKPAEKYNAAMRKTILGYELFDTTTETTTFMTTTNLLLQKYLLHK